MCGMGSGRHWYGGRERHHRRLPLHRRAALETGWADQPLSILRLAVVTAWRCGRFHAPCALTGLAGRGQTMTLSALIKKGGLTASMTATVATPATQETDKPVTVAPVATVAVAELQAPPYTHTHNSQKPTEQGNCADSADSAYRDSEQESSNQEAAVQGSDENAFRGNPGPLITGPKEARCWRGLLIFFALLLEVLT